jgi:hypothetical protein
MGQLMEVIMFYMIPDAIFSIRISKSELFDLDINRSNFISDVRKCILHTENMLGLIGTYELTYQEVDPSYYNIRGGIPDPTINRKKQLPMIIQFRDRSRIISKVIKKFRNF